MSLTKHRLFKIKISDDGKFSFENSAEKQITEFLAESNYVYINHSITTLSETVDHYNNYILVNKYLVVSLVYKDLNETSFDLKGTSKKTQKIVKQETENGEKITNPIPKTEFDKAVQKLESPELPPSYPN